MRSLCACVGSCVRDIACEGRIRIMTVFVRRSLKVGVITWCDKEVVFGWESEYEIPREGQGW